MKKFILPEKWYIKGCEHLRCYFEDNEVNLTGDYENNLYYITNKDWCYSHISEIAIVKDYIEITLQQYKDSLEDDGLVAVYDFKEENGVIPNLVKTKEMEHKEFKVGDKVYVEGVIKYIDNDPHYPIDVEYPKGRIDSFTIDGRFGEEEAIILKHIEELPKPEYPKWMFVSNIDANCKTKSFARYVKLFHNNRYYAVRNAFNEEMLLKETTSDLKQWIFANDIVEEKPKVQIKEDVIKKEIEEIRTEITNMWDSLSKLILKIENLKLDVEH